MSEGPARVNREMSGAQVTERQLKRANEPTFTRALGDKKAAERHSATAPRQLRRHEADELRTTTADAQRSGATAMGAMAAQRVTTGQGVGSGKGRAKSRDEEKRAQVTALLQGVFDTMKKDVESILEGLEKRVDDQFTRGEKEARDAFTAEHRRKMEEYKDRRYSGVIGKFRWIRDLFVGLPAEADRIFDDARAGYLRRMRQVISDVATTIGSELDRAKRRIAQGRTELQAAVRRLPPICGPSARRRPPSSRAGSTTSPSPSTTRPPNSSTPSPTSTPKPSSPSTPRSPRNGRRTRASSRRPSRRSSPSSTPSGSWADCWERSSPRRPARS
ncbi:hypothetical protein [Streptomyces clavuligerus]|uniref:hypothetical protein n=1 Tax=Streptomyces clavuligerus TaxID=1901 RepID=UPI0030B87533